MTQTILTPVREYKKSVYVEERFSDNPCVLYPTAGSIMDYGYQPDPSYPDKILYPGDMLRRVRDDFDERSIEVVLGPLMPKRRVFIELVRVYNDSAKGTVQDLHEDGPSGAAKVCEGLNALGDLQNPNGGIHPAHYDTLLAVRHILSLNLDFNRNAKLDRDEPYSSDTYGDIPKWTGFVHALAMGSGKPSMWRKDQDSNVLLVRNGPALEIIS
ncbi:MAG: hypothetical protein KDJ50_06080 [Alphaproteobacteria bacterium]|nr:hypothetical protein [Alphaproteobacteria bacterium]